ncbi:MAG: insulinase family protein [Gemmatimonadetes bacterium]|nr:insulinase family protein [Gemmatimonadota bacterium]MBK7348374.1 insulinase family protein [Gemmatimonadota bacterium]MBK7713944.1 insulinase family protein [Gemmatimonadota bacterium]MBK9068951.1 insulinase family protein [Gemmatimonadota bacterium]
METTRLDQGLFRTVAPNGLVVQTELLPGVRSVAAGVWVRTASAHEPRAKMGVSHLLEHMVFKGTARRSARQLALELEARGGALDAYTSRDHTNYQAHVLDEDLPRALDVLTDLVRRPLLREEDLALERNVVLEEIATVEDTPDDQVFELFSEQLWPEHPYGYSILGTRASVSELSAGDLRAVHGSGYHPGNCVVAAAGRVDHEAILELLGREGWFDGETATPRRAPVTPVPARRGEEHRVARDSAQTHLVVGSDTFPYRDRRRFALSIITNAFGGGMSSRLFQRIREELGLAYGVYAYQQFFEASGVAGVYLGTQPATADQAAEAVRGEYTRLASEGLPAEELAQGKQQLKGQVMLSLESPVNRMNRLATLALHDEAYRPLDAILAEIDAVTGAEIAGLTAEYFDPARQTVVRLGPA